MKTYQGSEIRNVAVVGHAHSGKTTLIAALLHAAKMTPTQGRVADGTAVTAYDEEEVGGLGREGASGACVSALGRAGRAGVAGVTSAGGAGGAGGLSGWATAAAASGPLNAASNARVASERFQFNCIVFILSPFINAWGAAQAVHNTTMAVMAIGPKILTNAAPSRGSGDHARPSRCIRRCTRRPRWLRKPDARNWPSGRGRVRRAPNSTRHSARILGPSATSRLASSAAISL